MVKHHVVWTRETRLWFLSSSGIKFMFANEAKLLNEVLPANPLLNQLLQFLSTRKRNINDSATTGQEVNPSCPQGGFCRYNSYLSQVLTLLLSYLKDAWTTICLSQNLSLQSCYFSIILTSCNSPGNCHCSRWKCQARVRTGLGQAAPLLQGFQLSALWARTLDKDIGDFS